MLFWQDPPRISRRKVAAQRPLDFSLTNYHLTDGYPHVFSWPISFFNSYAVNRNNLSPYILSSELQCLLHGDSRNLCTNTRVQLLATHLLCHYKNSRTSSKILNHFLFWHSCTYFMSEKWRKKTTVLRIEISTSLIKALDLKFVRIFVMCILVVFYQPAVKIALNPYTALGDQEKNFSLRQADEWEERKISLRGLLVDPTPNSLNSHHKNCMADSRKNY